MSNIDVVRLKEKVEKCRNISFDDVDIAKLKDISEMRISKKKSSKERILDFLNTVENPYIFKVNNILVKIEFSNNNKSAEESITNVIKSLYK